MQGREYQKLVEISEEFQTCYSTSNRDWEGSPFEWIKGGVTSPQKGKVGKHMVKKFLQWQDFSVTPSLVGTDSDMTVNGSQVEVKFSTLWKSDIYKFQQIRDQKYDIIFCLGLSPEGAHAWVIKKSDIVWNDLRNQHGGRRGSDTWWISFSPPRSPYSWMHPQNGDLSKVCHQLRRML